MSRPMSLAPSMFVPRSRFNALPLYIGLFCLLWSYASLPARSASPIARR